MVSLINGVPSMCVDLMQFQVLKQGSLVVCLGCFKRSR